jgi:hypothetical protein
VALHADVFRAELRAFRRPVESVLGSFPVIGFRAPTFSIDRSNPWALDVLREEGYRYDSSIFPMKVKMYGTAGRAGGHLPAVARRRAPARSGGRPGGVPGGDRRGAGRALPGRRRLLPARAAARGVPGRLDFILRHRPFALYLHPREITPEARRSTLDPVNGFITYVNLHTVMAKLEHLFERYAGRRCATSSSARAG